MTGGAYAVLVVTHDSGDEIDGCLAAVAALDPPPAELVVVDCASADASVERARAAWPAGLAGAVLPLPENRGFAGGMNAALAASAAPWALLLNPDARPEPSYVAALLARAAEPDLRVGGVTGRLLRRAATGEEPRLDACGMYLTPAWRHHDRGSGEPAAGRHQRPARVFGGTGAATLFRRAALADAALAGEMLDERFHSFREDAELAFRLRERGWEILYEPAALCEHRRFNLPARRGAMPPHVNFHSLKNRYLLRLTHQTLGNFLWTLPFATARDLMALAWALAFERPSLPAYAWLWRRRREIWARRRQVLGRRTVPPGAIDRWFVRRALPLAATEEGR